MAIAPVVLFVYKRLTQTQATVDALKKNILASDTDLYIYSDGPKTAADVEAITVLRTYLKSITGFKSITIRESGKNNGLATSIISGVSEIVNRYGRVIVLEDDIMTSVYFLKFMNDALNTYEDEEAVKSISGYMYPHQTQLPDTFFFNVPLCWGWATWKRAWDQYNDSADFHITHLTKTNQWKAFNKFGGGYLERQLRKNATGKMNTWFIYWHASVFFHRGYCLYPGITLVENTGFDSSGEHGASTGVYFSPVSTREIQVEKQPLIENAVATRIIKRFYLFKANSYIKAAKRLLGKVFGKH
ncbi:MAG TPA: hypothetical protein VD884_06945 [Ohtaekwangia sp.]|nr:hypothetical protein [Ohtaekwangia sp.]